ncbi:MAG TPA: extracellular solute-binding protein [Desulfosporosinus sp.]|nr:extracellular solute-binding protein [Desulfosporosinus sp.]
MRHKSMRIFIASLILALPLLISCRNEPQEVLAPVAQNNTEKVTLECVVPFDDVKKNEAFEHFEADMNALFPNVDIHLDSIKGDANAYNTKIKVMMYSTTPPDIFYSGDGNFTNQLSSTKSIQPLGKKLNELHYWDRVIPTAQVMGDTGQIYAVPIDEASYNIMLINTEIFSNNNVKIPESFEELKGAVNQFKEKNIIPIALGGKDGMPVYNMIEGFAGAIDDEITGKIVSGNDGFSGEIFSKATRAVTQLIELDAFQEKTQTISDEEAGNLFYSSKAAIYATSSDQLTMAKQQLKGKVAVLYYPNLSETNRPIPKNIVSGGPKKDCGLLISSSTKYPTEAASIAVEMSMYYNKYLYENSKGATIYNLDNLEWKQNIVPNVGISELMMNVKQKGHVNRRPLKNCIFSFENSIVH